MTELEKEYKVSKKKKLKSNPLREYDFKGVLEESESWVMCKARN